jgi:hypothetical protein
VPAVIANAFEFDRFVKGLAQRGATARSDAKRNSPSARYAAPQTDSQCQRAQVNIILF